jgi:hypothetical protein
VNLLLAIFAKKNGDIGKALRYKNLADEAATAMHSGFTYHKGLGLVKKRDIELETIFESMQ